MKKLTTASLLVSVLITVYCFFEYEMPHAQYTKVLSDLKTAGINDQELIERVRWGIVGVQTTWRPLLFVTLCQNALLVVLLAKLSISQGSTTQSPAPLTQH